MTRFYKLPLLCAIACSLATTALVANDDAIEDAIEYRQGVFSVVAWNFVPLTKMVKGEQPFDAAAAKKMADRLVMVAPMALEGFIAGSDKDSVKIKTGAKAEIWKNMDDFKAKMGDMEKAVAALPAATGSVDTLKVAVGNVGKTCKACHDEYRQK